jgi:hypothetical protein
MSEKFNDLTCGSVPEELFESLLLGYSVYLMPCKNCGKTLVNIKSEVVPTDEGHKVYAYFKCECGKKYRKVALDLHNEGYLCRQGLVHKQPERIRHGMQGWSNPSVYYITFYDNDMEPVYYIVRRDEIQLKKGTPKNV